MLPLSLVQRTRIQQDNVTIYNKLNRPTDALLFCYFISKQSGVGSQTIYRMIVRRNAAPSDAFQPPFFGKGIQIVADGAF